MSDRVEKTQTSQPALSFTRLDSSLKGPLSRSRASTLQATANPSDLLDPLNDNTFPDEDDNAPADVFADKLDDAETKVEELRLPHAFEELPIEIRSLTERFLDSLIARVHPTPLTADALANMFQDFYVRAAAKINTHIATLSARLTSDAFVAQSKKALAPSSRPSSIRKGTDSSEDQQMLSATEMADRKRARRALEIKRHELEETVERSVCEKLYEKLWRHRSTDDEEKDHKLRSRTAALSLVGIGLNELLMTGEEWTEGGRQKAKEKEPEIKEWLSAARQDLLRMNDEKCPLGKIRHLTAAHTSIVEALSKIFPATSSADEILPTLIYALITLPPVHLNVISDLKFIQRFRGSSRIDGETAYCLVNLEAAVSFLETVDLSSLRAEEVATSKSDSHPPNKSKITPMSLGLSQEPDLVQNGSTQTSKGPAAESSTTIKAQRRLSNLIQAHTNKIEAASDAVRESIIESADQALGRINDTLDHSFKFFFGGPRNSDPNSPAKAQPELPKTLEDARKLVSPPIGAERDDDSPSVSAPGSTHGDEYGEVKSLEAKMADLFAGKKTMRDRSADSAQSRGSSSGSRLPFPSMPSSDDRPPAVPPKNDINSPLTVDSLRSMSNSLNPLHRLASINVLPRFGRALSSSSSSIPVLASPGSELPKPAPPTESPNGTPSSDVSRGGGEERGVRALAALEQLKKTTPPVRRFVEAKDAQNLKLKEVDDLLKEYQRLAAALRATIHHV